MNKILGITATLVILAIGSIANAATHTIVGGQLVGATGVDVGGTLYDVQFVDGSCTSLFNGCNDPLTDFTFTTYQDANLARIALSEQVFTDSAAGNFDSDPSLTNGLGSEGRVMTPYRYHPTFTEYLVAVQFWNAISEASDSITSSFSLPYTLNTGFYDDRTYAVWTVSAVPLPAALPLYGAGMAILGFIGWRRKHV